jgi:hypothetical protein
MKKYYFLFLAIFITIVIFSGCKDNSSETKDETGTINGVVLDAATNAPIANALITTEPPTESLVTNDSGQFTIDIVVKGSYLVKAEKTGYYSKQVPVSVVKGKITSAYILLEKIVAGNSPPNPPANPVPMTGSTIKSNSVDLSWTCSDPDNDQLTYDVYLSEYNPPTTKIASNLSDHTYNITGLESNKKYYWRVVATDEHGASTTGNVWSFTVMKEVVYYGDLIAYWSFDDGNAKDQSVNNLDGIVSNTVSFVQGKKGLAAYILGYGVRTDQGGHILVPRINFEQFDEFTISIWINEESTTYFHGPGFIGWGDLTYGWLGISHAGNDIDSTSNLKFSVGGGTYSGIQPLKIDYDYGDRYNWIHYCLVYKNGTIYAYRNAVLVGSLQQSIKIYDVSNYGGIARSWYSYDGLQTCTRFNGMIDEVKIYRKALSQQEINDLYNI